MEPVQEILLLGKLIKRRLCILAFPSECWLSYIHLWWGKKPTKANYGKRHKQSWKNHFCALEEEYSKPISNLFPGYPRWFQILWHQDYCPWQRHCAWLAEAWKLKKELNYWKEENMFRKHEQWILSQKSNQKIHGTLITWTGRRSSRTARGK